MKTLPQMPTGIIRGLCALTVIGFAAISSAQSSAAPSATTEPQTNTTAPTVATSPVAAPAGQPSQADIMKQMMEMAKPNENHKLLADTTGTWSYTIKMWMDPDPNAKPQESKGTATRKMALDGHYLIADHVGKMKMPGPDGKPRDFAFHGMAIEAYDNAKKKFEATWMDNMGTGIVMSEGTFDPAGKAWTYTGEMEMAPGMKTQFREVVKLTDKDHMVVEWYETGSGQEKKTMEMNYARTSKG